MPRVELKGRFSKGNVASMLYDEKATIRKEYPHFYDSRDSLRGTSVLGSRVRFLNTQDEAMAYGAAELIEDIIDVIPGGIY